MNTMNETLMESTNSGSLRGGPFVACAALWPRPVAMMSNKVPSMTSAACVQGHTKRNVDTQPTTVLNTVTVTRDTHEEGFDIGPHIRALPFLRIFIFIWASPNDFQQRSSYSYYNRKAIDVKRVTKSITRPTKSPRTL